MREIKDPVCHIVGAGDFFGMIAPKSGDCVIAADGGLNHLESISVSPDLILGDFDSANMQDERSYKCTVMRYSSHKDDTDMMLAVRQGLARGYRSFMLYGGTGGRLDHTLANVQCLNFLAERGARAWLIGGDFIITVLAGGDTLRFPEDIPCVNGMPSLEAGCGVSVFAIGGDADGVSISGMQYPLSDSRLKSTVSLGVSNAIKDASGEISVREGSIAIYIGDNKIS